MKKKYYLLIIILIVVKNLTFSQQQESGVPPCENSKIRTDPKETNATKNLEWPNMTNTRFDWMDWNTLHTTPQIPAGLRQTIPVYYTNWIGGGPYLLMMNPYFMDVDYLSHLPNIHNMPTTIFNTLNYQGLIDNFDITSKEQGWELVWKSDGYNMDGTEITDGAYMKPPNFILYNRYTGLLRWFSVLPPHSGDGTRNNLKMSIDFTDIFDPTTNTSFPRYSALFRNYKNVSKALDQLTEVVSIEAPAGMSNDYYQYSMADFQMSYDPCQCHLPPSMLNFHTHEISTSTVNLYGRLQGTGYTSQPFQNSGNITSSQWLPSVWSDGSGDHLNGMIQYKNVGDMTAKYKTNATSQNWSQDAKDKIDVVKNAVSLGLSVFSGIPKLNSFSSKDLKKGTEDLSLIADFLSFAFNDKQNNNSTPPMTIEAEMSLTGYVTETVNDNGFDFRIYNPGSYKTLSNPDAAGYDKYYYPIYNESMGLFALVKTPKGYTSTGAANQEPTRKDVNWNYSFIDANGQQQNGNVWVQFAYSNPDIAFQLKEPIVYTMNPAARIDNANTTITAAWVVEFRTNPYANPWWYWNIVSPNMPFSYKYNYDGLTTDERYVYTSEFYPLECIQNFVPKFTYDMVFNNINGGRYIPTQSDFDLHYATLINQARPFITKVYLKLNVYYRFDDINDELLQSPQTFQTFKYEIDNNYTTTADLTVSPNIQAYNIPDNLTISTTNYNSSQTIYAWDKITVTGDLTTDPGVVITIIAGENIELLPGVEISPEITLQIGKISLCSSSKILPTTLSETDCQNSSNYKGNQFYGKTSNRMQYLNRIKNKNDGNDIFTLKVYPNPSKNTCSIDFTLKKDETVTISISDVTGKIIYKAVNESAYKQGRFTVPVNMDLLDNGIYFCTFTSTDGYNETKKIVVVKE